ncbi:MAG: phenylalanine--tRNA ligase beta subunit-related protein, partial [candidate division WOR-3 bacterium]
MRVSTLWLNELAGTNLAARELATEFDAKGVPVADISRIGEAFEGSVVVEVAGLGARTVTVFDGRNVQEVECAVAELKEDARLAFHPERRKVLTEQDVGLTESPVPVQLPEQAESGRPVLDFVDDSVLILDPPPNRGDLTGIVGLARELASYRGREWRPSQVAQPPGVEQIAERLSLEVTDQGDTPDYIARLVTGVRVGPAPFWLRWRLAACGLRAISNVVDVTNYLLFKYGQPLHAFDFGRIRGARIVTRRARGQESITTIDGVRRQLDEGILVIADEARPVAVAGIMGGIETEIGIGTHEVLIECARFNPAVIRRGARTLGLATEASERFERGTDPSVMEPASREAAALIAQFAGGRVLAGVCEARSEVPVRALGLSWTRTNRLLGLQLTPA